MGFNFILNLVASALEVRLKLDERVSVIILRLLNFYNSITFLKEVAHIGVCSDILNYEWFLRVHTSPLSHYF